MLSDLLVFIIRSDMRASLSQETLNYFLFVKESMGLLATFDPRQNCKIMQKSIAKWMTLRKDRRTQDIQVVENFGPNLPLLFKLQTARNVVS